MVRFCSQGARSTGVLGDRVCLILGRVSLMLGGYTHVLRSPQTNRVVIVLGALFACTERSSGINQAPSWQSFVSQTLGIPGKY
jgi:hypothetical protein